MVWGSGESHWIGDVLVFRFLDYSRWKSALTTVRAVPATLHAFKPVPASHVTAGVGIRVSLQAHLLDIWP